MLFPGFSVNDNDDVLILVCFISIVMILFLVVAYAKPAACKKASKNEVVLSSARDLQTSNIIFTVGANRSVVQKFDARKIYRLSNEVIFFRPLFCLFLRFCF